MEYILKNHIIESTVLFSLFLLLCSSCNGKKGDNNIGVERLSIDISKAVDLGDVLHSGKLVSMENCDMFPGVLHKGGVVNDTLFILDPARSPGVYVYDNEYRLINKFPSIGQGPGEISSIMDMQVDDKYVYLLDFMRGSVEKYAHNGEWLGSISIPGGAASIMPAESGLWCDFSNQTSDVPGKLVHSSGDRDGSVTVLYNVPAYLENVSYSSAVTFQKSGEDVLYLPSLETDIYTLTDSTVTKKYTLDYNGLWPDKSFFEDLKDMDPVKRAEMLRNKLPVGRQSFYANEAWLVVAFVNNDVLYMYFKDLKTGGSKIVADKNKTLSKVLCLDGNKLFAVDREDQLVLFTIQ